MATIAGDSSVYNANTNWENERKYLTGLANSGNSWATQQLEALNRAQAQYTQPAKATTPTTTKPSGTQGGIGVTVGTGQAYTAPATQPVAQPVVQTTQTPTSSGGAKYTYQGNTYDNYTDWVMAQTGATAEQVARAQAQSSGVHSDVLAALRGYNTPNAGILAQDKIEKELQGFYDRWLNIQDDPTAYLYGTTFEEALNANGGMDAIYRALQSTGYKGVNQGLTDAQYAEMLQRVTGGNTQGAADGYSLAYKLVNGIEAPEVQAYKSALSTPTGGAAAGTPGGSMAGGGSVAGSSSSGTPGFTANDQSALIDALYKAQQDAALAALKSAYDENMLALDASAQGIPAEYQAARNRTAADAAVQRRNFNQYAAANGLNNGAAGQAQLAMNNQLQSGLSSISRAEAESLSALEMERTRAKVQYQNAIAQAIAEGDAARAQALYNEAVRVDESLIAAAYQQAQLAYQQATLDRALAGDAFSQALSRAEFLADMGDISGAYAALGMSAPVANAGGGYVGNGGGGPSPLETETPVQNRLPFTAKSSGTLSAQDLLAATGISPDMLSTMQNNTQGIPYSPTFYEMPMTNLRQIVIDTIRTAQAAPLREQQLTVVQNRAKDLTDAEYQYVLSQLGLL